MDADEALEGRGGAEERRERPGEADGPRVGEVAMAVSSERTVGSASSDSAAAAASAEPAAPPTAEPVRHASTGSRFSVQPAELGNEGDATSADADADAASSSPLHHKSAQLQRDAHLRELSGGPAVEEDERRGSAGSVFLGSDSGDHHGGTSTGGDGGGGGSAAAADAPTSGTSNDAVRRTASTTSRFTVAYVADKVSPPASRGAADDDTYDTAAAAEGYGAGESVGRRDSADSAVPGVGGAPVDSCATQQPLYEAVALSRHGSSGGGTTGTVTTAGTGTGGVDAGGEPLAPQPSITDPSFYEPPAELVPPQAPPPEVVTPDAGNAFGEAEAGPGQGPGAAEGPAPPSECDVSPPDVVVTVDGEGLPALPPSLPPGTYRRQREADPDYESARQVDLYALLFFLGTLASLSDWVLEWATDEILHQRAGILRADATVAGRAVLWVSYTAVSAVVAQGVTHVMSPVQPNRRKRTAATGGIPELKAKLSGSQLPEWDSLRMYAAKFVGMMLALSSGLPVGKEGPFVHMACVVGIQLIELFTVVKAWLAAPRGVSPERRKTDPKLVDQILQAAAATALGAAFRAPIGGVLFSVEVTAASYRLDNYAKGFFAAVAGATSVFLLADLESGYRWSLANDADVTRKFGKWEILAFMALGVVLGALGAVYVRCYTLVRRAFARVGPFLFGSKWETAGPLRTGATLCAAVGAATAALQVLQGEYGTLGLRETVSDLWTEADLREGRHAPGVDVRADNWGRYGSTGVAALAYAATVFACSVAAITLPVVAGLFTPTIAVGAGLGRAAGELMYWAFPEVPVSRSGYAYVGAAAFSAGCTQTISTAIAVLEMTGELDFAIPILVAVVLSVLVSTRVGPSVFDRISALSGLPNMVLPGCDISDRVASDVVLMPTVLPVRARLGQVAFAMLRGAYTDLGIDRDDAVRVSDQTLVDDRRDRVVCVVERLPNEQLIGVSMRKRLHRLLTGELQKALEELEGILARRAAADFSTDAASGLAPGPGEAAADDRRADGVVIGGGDGDGDGDDDVTAARVTTCEGGRELAEIASLTPSAVAPPASVAVDGGNGSAGDAMSSTRRRHVRVSAAGGQLARGYHIGRHELHRDSKVSPRSSDAGGGGGGGGGGKNGKGGSILRTVRGGLEEAFLSLQSALLSDQRYEDRNTSDMTALLRSYREAYVAVTELSVRDPSVAVPPDCLRRVMSLDAVDGRPDIGANLVSSALRVQVSCPLADVINYMLTQPSQFCLVYDFGGALVGMVTVEHLNRRLSEWHEAERAQRKGRPVIEV